MNREVRDEILRAARLHRSFVEENGIQCALLGGCWLSWMSDQHARDLDFFVSKYDRPLVEKLGFSFTTRSRYSQIPNSEGGFVVSKDPIFFKEQMILIDGPASLAWMTFDYQHVMLGIDSYDYTVISVGLPAIKQEILIKNLFGKVMQHRDNHTMAEKLLQRSIWGRSPGAVEQAFQEVTDVYLEYVGKKKLTKRVPVPDPPEQIYDFSSAHHTVLNSLLDKSCYVCGVRASKLDSSGIPTCGRC